LQKAVSLPTKALGVDDAQAAGRYWDAHPISTDSVGYAPGSRESFEAIYEKWRATEDEARRQFLESCRGLKVLEIGCGIGKDARYLCENGIDYWGLDYSFRSVRMAQDHLAFAGLAPCLLNADASTLPFRDGAFGLTFSIGVLHHIADTPAGCRELLRVLRPGGTLRVMFYNRHSYHYALVAWLVSPLIWLLLKLPLLQVLLLFAPCKLRHLHAIAERYGFSRARVLATSADTSVAQEDGFVRKTSFYTEAELRKLFAGAVDFRFSRSDLKYFPLPFLRRFVEKRWGFFLTMTARKPEQAR
jgi:ubiquinone/menaquinone biosynthesis C-methylase UbiE